jgi:hypothetical protein
MLSTTRRLYNWARGASINAVEAELRREIEEVLGSTRAHPIIATLAFDPMPPPRVMSRLARSVRRMLLPARPLVAYDWARPGPSATVAAELRMVARSSIPEWVTH